MPFEKKAIFWTIPTFEPRERPWYKLAEKSTRPVYTICSCAEIYRQVADGVIGETGFNVVMNFKIFRAQRLVVIQTVREFIKLTDCLRSEIIFRRNVRGFG